MSTWLLIDDDVDISEMILALYGMMGVEGVAFAHGEEAVEWIEQVDNGDWSHMDMPELALLDIRLPGQVTGDMIGARLRQSPILKNMVIVMMSAYRLSPREETELFNQSGADYVLYKPLPRLPEMERIFRNLLAERFPD